MAAGAGVGEIEAVYLQMAVAHGAGENGVSLYNGAIGTAEQERVSGAISYLDVLDRLHGELRPVHYLEIGIRHGRSLALARGAATGVDPAPEIQHELPPTTKIMSMTSDDFFAGSFDVAPDFCFIDGLHLFEYALRDFMNFERRAAPGAIAVIDDVFPNHPLQAERARQTRVWTGDVWRLVEVLRKHRPDLFLMPLDTAPTGLLLIAGLDPENRVLSERYDAIVLKAREISGPPQTVLERRGALDPATKYFDRMIEILKTTRRDGAHPQQTVAQLQEVQCDTLGRQMEPCAPPKLSVIVVGYNMARELPRTIRSLSPQMQRGIDSRDYEVILIDNGSTRPADEAELRRYLPDLVMHRLADATVSPVHAINFGLTLARGELVGVMIDGARMASPGLLANALAASRRHARPVIGTLSFHLGPAVQMESVKRGYNQTVEDELLAQSGWKNDGYRLFSISSFAGSSAGGWFELPAESNALFLRAEHWRELGGFDERFVTPGGGFANLDIWSRVCADPEGELIMLLGEATFHQVHGGIATNNPTPPQGLFNDEYVRIRGAPYTRPARRPQYFGTMPEVLNSGRTPLHQ